MTRREFSGIIKITRENSMETRMKISVLKAKKILGWALILLAVFVVAGGVGDTAFAQKNKTIRLENPLSSSGGPLKPEELYGRIIRSFLAFVGIASLVTFVFAGALFVASGGNPERVTKAKNAMLYAVIGIAVSIGSYVILSFVIDVLKGELL